MTYQPDNIFAKILRAELPCHQIYESDYSLAFYDVNPQANVHALVIPKAAYVSFADFSHRASTDEISGFFRDVGQVAELLKLTESGYRLIANHGSHAHQEVPHFHVHICGGEPLGAMLSHKPNP